MESLLNFETPLDVSLLDRAAKAFADGPNPEAQRILVTFQDHPLAWTRVDSILDKSSEPTSRYLALNILEKTVKHKWKILPPDQREGIKSYTVNLIIKLSSDYTTMKSQAAFMTKLNTVLVQIVKQEWPQNWVSSIYMYVSFNHENSNAYQLFTDICLVCVALCI